MTYSPEATLALRVAVAGDHFDAAAFEHWQASVDLDHLPPGHYALLPLIYSSLERHAIDHPWRPRLQGIYRKMWYANQLALRTVSEVVAALQPVAAPVMVVGAAALAATQYPELALRPILQPELNVADADAGHVLQTLQSLGWQPEPAAPHLLSAEFRLWTPGQRMVNPQAQALWLGWHLIPAAPCAELDAACRAASVPLPLATTTLTTLCPTDQLLHASTTTGETALIALVDAAFLLRGAEIEWPRLVELAGRYRLGLAVLTVLETLVHELELDVPAQALDALRRLPANLGERRVRRILDQPPATRSLGERSWLLWARYQRALACNGERSGLRTFSAFLRHERRLTSAWAAPLELARRIVPQETAHGGQS
jgi:hypothetical protein